MSCKLRTYEAVKYLGSFSVQGKDYRTTLPRYHTALSPGLLVPSLAATTFPRMMSSFPDYRFSRPAYRPSSASCLCFVYEYKSLALYYFGATASFHLQGDTLIMATEITELVDIEAYEAELRKPGVVVLDFYSTQCPPCKVRTCAPSSGWTTAHSGIVGYRATV